MASCSSGRKPRESAASCDQAKCGWLAGSRTDGVSGSIHNDVPVKPRCPYEVGEKRVPEDEGCEGVSHPRAREVPCGDSSRRVKSASVAGFTNGAPPFSRHSAKVARSVAEANIPACPLTPPMTQAFSSLTSPWMIRLRKLRSSSVGGICARISSGGTNQVRVRPSLSKISRCANWSSGSPARRSRILAEQDEADVAVFGASARCCGQRSGQGGAQQFFSVLRELEELLVGRQSAGVGQQHANGHRLALGLLVRRAKGHELGQ